MSDSDGDVPELTDRQKEVLTRLPASKRDIAEGMGVAMTTVEGHLNSLKEKDIKLSYDTAANVWHLGEEADPQLRRVSTKHKNSKTREATTLIEAEESRLLRRLEAREPMQAAPTQTEGRETLCVGVGDWHWGDKTEDDHGNVLWDMELATEAMERLASKVVGLSELERSYIDFDDCYLFLLGDMATGMHVYSGQVHDVSAYLSEQVTASSQALIDLILTLADEFETVHVRGVVGNHGTDRPNASIGSNTDLITYRWVQDGLRRSEVDNVTMEFAESTHHLNCQVRGYNVHLRHGQDGMEHVDKTSRSESDWRGYRDKHRYDMAVRGHFHNPGLDWVLNRYPVFSLPSPKTGDEFAERIGKPDMSARRHLGWMWGVSDDRPVTFKRLVDMDMEGGGAWKPAESVEVGD